MSQNLYFTSIFKMFTLLYFSKPLFYFSFQKSLFYFNSQHFYFASFLNIFILLQFSKYYFTSIAVPTLVAQHEGKIHFGDIGVYERIILKWSIKNSMGRHGYVFLAQNTNKW
jgi:hypothetical protein